MASSQIEFASSTSPFGCINHHPVRKVKNLFNHFVRDRLNSNNNNNSHSWDTNNKAKNNLGTLRFASSNNQREEQDESSSSSLVVSPNHEEPSSSLSSPSSSPPLRKQRPPPISVPSDCVSNRGASSLVQIWEKRLTQSSSSNTTKSSSSPKYYSPNASSLSASASSSSPQSSSSAEEEADSPQGQILHNERDHHDHDHDHDHHHNHLRVADIIKRLTATRGGEEIVDNNNNNETHHEDHQNYCVGSPDQQSSLENNRSFVINSPIRGRQAFNDLLMQMESDRHGELNDLADRAAVSKFSYRGRIQSLLRLKLMQRGMAKDYQRSSPSTTSHVIKKLPQGSLIMRLRERFGTGIKYGTPSIEEEAVERETPCREKENKLVSPIYNNNPPNLTQNPVSHAADHNKEEEKEEEEAPPCPDVSVPTSSKPQNADTSSSSMASLNAESEVSAENNVEGREEKHDNVCGQTSYNEMEEEEEGNEEEEYGERMYDEIEEEAENSSEQINYGEEANNFDWISQISKPKSYWEDRRRAWYKEMLDNHESQNHDICQLLQRRTVSNFLCSNFRETMDRLMESHKGTQTNLLSSRDNNGVNNHHGKIGQQLIAFLQQRLNNNPAKRDQEEEDIKAEEDHQEEEEEEEDDDDDDDEEEEEEEKQEEEEEILISGSYNGESDSVIQSSPSQWRYGDDSDQYRAASATSTQPSQSPPFFLNTHQNSSPTNPPSMEMELIYDLGGHMKQLYQEMSELRKSIRSCMDMQMTLTKSLNRQNHTVKGKKSYDRVLKKGNCCMCLRMKADSLLYRCGHMCTCLKCANELQWKNGTCPICEAPIVDVVRVYVDA